MLRLPRASSLLAFGLSLSFTFSTASAVDFSSGSYTQLPGDFNADGLIDVLYQPLDTSTGGAIVLQDKTGQLSIVSQSWSAGYLGIDWAASDTRLTAADLNGDHFDDVVVQPVEPGSPAAVLLMNGSSQLAQVSQAIPANYLGFDWSSTTHQVVVGDFDGDGRKELLMQAIAPGDPSYVVHADATGHLAALSQPVEGQAAIVDGYLSRRWNAQDVRLYVGDFNGDGRQDLLMQVNPGAPNASESDYALLLADANGQFTSVAETWNKSAMGQDWDPATHKILIEDVNGDHIMDIVVQSTDPNGTSFLMEGNTQGTFTQAAAHWTGTKTPAQIAALLPSGSSSVSTATPASSKLTLAAPVQTRTMMANAMVTANAVGALQGSGGVSGGSATYSIPIQVPPGIAGMQPSISLSYSSRGGNGEMGMGWSLNAGSEIHRCPATFAMDGYASGVTYTANDRLCLDGQHLILVSGTYGADQATYRTELDSFSLITESGAISSGTSYFYVSTKANHQLRYGYGSNIGASPNTVLTPVGAPAPLAWALGMDLDASNNSIIYYYTAYGAGENLLTSIKYTGLGATAGDREVDFTYVARNDVTSQYLAGSHSSQTQVLNSITTSASGTPVRQYNLQYQASGASTRSLLTAVQECAGSGATAACLAATTFTWQQAAPDFRAPSPIDTSDGCAANHEDVNGAHISTPGDLDGDGFKDLVVESACDTMVYFMGPGGAPRGPGVSIRSVFPGVGYEGDLVDINGDGAADLTGTMPDQTLGYTSYVNGAFTQPLSLGIPVSQLVAIKDVNGDGLPDIVVVMPDPFHANSHMLAVYLNATPPCATVGCHPTPVFNTTPTPIFTAPDQPGQPQPVLTVQPAQDMDGNGLPDFAMSYYTADGVQHSWWVLTQNTGGTVGATYVNQRNDGRNLTTAWTATMMDINGDGLPDAVYDCANLDFCYALNTGAAGSSMFGTEVDTGVHDWRAGDPTATSGTLLADIDNDGAEEILFPGTQLAKFCDSSVGPEQQEKCFPQLPSDFGIYAYYEIKFSWQQLPSGVYGYKPVRTPTSIQAQCGLAVAVDLAGDGITSVVSPFTQMYQTGELIPQNGYPLPVGPQAVMNVNSSSTSADAAPDLMLSAVDGFQHHETWTYYPLSSSATFNGLHLYASSNTSPNANDVVGAGYFHFASSMYVVGQYTADNGIGSSNEHDFHYGQGIYNDQGHGFQGFRTVVDDDVARGARTVQVYHQHFPLSGLLQESWTTSQAASNAANFDLLNPVVDGGAVDHVVTQVACNVGQGAEWLNTPTNGIYNVDGINCSSIMNAKTFFPFISASTETRYDLVTHTPLSTTVTQYCSLTNMACTGDGYDAFGNLLGSLTTVTDSEGTYTSAVANTYVTDNSSWWINKLTSSVVSNDAVYLGQTDAGAVSRETDYTYNTFYRTLNTAITNYLTASNPSNPGLSTTATYVYSRNNLISTTVTGGSGTTAVAARTTSTDYSTTGGYFPDRVTNALGQVVTMTTDPRFGEPSMVIDVNGITTAYSYDVFGRKISTQTATLPVQTIQYLAADSNCDAGAVYYTLTQQSGTPNQAVCYDMLNRTVNVDTVGFSQTIVQDTQYDKLGRVTAVSEPYFAGNNATAHSNTTSYMPDILGRVAEKVDAKGVITDYNYNPPDDTVQNSYLRPMTRITTTTPNDPLNGGYVRVDEEVHNSLGKMISVTNALGAAEQATTAYAYDRDGNPVTITAADGTAITAVYDIAGRKLSVTDPDQGTTTYTYDALGELLTQTDAKAQTLTMTYDLLGRMRSKSSSVAGEGTSTWCYDVPANADGTCPQNGLSATQTNTVPYIGKQSAVLQTAPAFKETYTYDSLSRPTRVSDFVDGSSNSNDTDTIYNSLGQVDTVTYPAAVADAGPQITSLTSSRSVPPSTPVTLTAAVTAGNGPQAPEYLWTQTGGPAVSLSASTALSTTFTTGAMPGTVYTFRFQTDDGLMVNSGTVTITVPALPAASATITTDGDPGHSGVYVVSWSSTPVTGDTTKYHLQEAVGNASGPTGAFSDYTAPAGVTGTSITVNRSANASYYYYYREYGTDMSGGPVGYSPVVGIHVVVRPGVPGAFNPASQENESGAYSVYWGASGGLVTSYQLFMDSTPAFSGQWYVGSTPNAFYGYVAVPGLGTWYVHVRACNINADLTICSDWSSYAALTYDAPSGGGGGGCPPAPRQCQFVLNDSLVMLTPVSTPIPGPLAPVTFDRRLARPADMIAQDDSAHAQGMRSVRVRPRFAPPVYQAWADLHAEDATTQIPLGRVSVHYVYTASGYLQQMVNAVRPSTVYWTATGLNARGQVTTEQFGSSVSTTHTYDDASGFEQEIASTAGATSVQDLRMQWYETGNLYSRSATLTVGGTTYNPSEVFGYDLHNRLLSAQVTNASGPQTPVTYAYGLAGNITCKSDVVGSACTTGSTGYVYGQGGGPHALTSAGSHSYSYDPDGNMQMRDSGPITWNSDNLPTQINQGTESDSFSYAPDKHRYKQSIQGLSPGTTYYFGSQEVVGGASTEFRHWLTAYGKPVAQVVLSADSSGNSHETVSYVLTDHLGSVVGLLDSSTLVPGYQSFAALGQHTDPTTWAIGGGPTLGKHGFTDHEHLDNVGLIHMNGRLMDPTIGRMLSVDPIYQAPTNTQSVNPYSYVMNNPLSLVDPSGYAAEAACSTGSPGSTPSCDPSNSDLKSGDSKTVSYTPTGSHIAVTVTATVQSDGSVAITSNNAQVSSTIANNVSNMLGNGTSGGSQGTNAPTMSNVGGSANQGAPSQRGLSVTWSDGCSGNQHTANLGETPIGGASVWQNGKTRTVDADELDAMFPVTGGTDRQRAAWKSSIIRDGQTGRGSVLFAQAILNGAPIATHFNSRGIDQAGAPGGPVDYDPDFLRTVRTTKNSALPVSFDRAVAHELYGHAIDGTLDKGPDHMDNVRRNENPIMMELAPQDGERTTY